MGECAFCDHAGTLTAEHIVSKWIVELFPKAKREAWYIDGTTQKEKRFTTDSLDWKARTVCKKCNETWMSDIESEHAKPALTPLITGQSNIPIGLSDAHSIALFAFKTAVILDCAHAGGTPYFSRRIRHAFRQHRAIPFTVNMWFCAYGGHRWGGQFKTVYLKGQASPSNHFLMYVCSCAIGAFVFQVVAVKQIGGAMFTPLPGFEHLAVPFWPALPRDFIWPPPFALASKQQFEAFADRWRTVRMVEL